MKTAIARRLPDIGSAALPATYERAKVALAMCERIDECQDWADKAAALASYAKQSDDPTLHRLATRIQARAVRRCGELLKTFQTGPQGGRPKGNGADSDTVSQREAAAAAGLSKRQEVTAVRVANVPDAEFESAIESEPPPSVTALAARGTDKREPVPGVAEATRLIGLMRTFAEFCETHPPAVVRVGVFPHEVRSIRQHTVIIGKWLQIFVPLFEEETVHAETTLHRRTPARRDRRPARRKAASRR